MKSFLALLTQAAEIIEQNYPDSMFYEADGIPSGGAAQQEPDVDPWRFVFLGPPQNDRTTSVILNFQAGQFGPAILHDPILGDRVIDLPIEMGLERAIEIKNGADHSGPFDAVTFRWPLSPGN